MRLDALLAPGMRERRSGAIVHVSSAAVPTPVAPFLHYTAAKAALENYSRELAAELAPFRIRVDTVAPGATDTTPLGRGGLPDDIVDAVLYLVSDRASFVTGSLLVVDGGEYPRS